MRELPAPRTPPLIAAPSRPQATERHDRILIVVAVTLALLVEFAIYAFMASH